MASLVFVIIEQFIVNLNKDNKMNSLQMLLRV